MKYYIGVYEYHAFDDKAWADGQTDDPDAYMASKGVDLSQAVRIPRPDRGNGFDVMIEGDQVFLFVPVPEDSIQK